MEKVVKGLFKAVSVPQQMPKEVKVGDKLPISVLEQTQAEEKYRIDAKISDPSRVRPFIDIPVPVGAIPEKLEERGVMVSQLLHHYRESNPKVIHGAGILIKEQYDIDEIEKLTGLYYQCQQAFITMVNDAIEQKALPNSPGSEDLIWEHIAFPRLVRNIHLLRACLLYLELDQDALIVHVLFLFEKGQPLVCSTRLSL